MKVIIVLINIYITIIKINQLDFQILTITINVIFHIRNLCDQK